MTAKCIGIVSALLTCWVLVATTEAQTHPVNAELLGEPHQLVALSDGKIALLTPRGVYVTDDDKMSRWTAIFAKPSDQFLEEIAGGSSDRVYLVTSESGDASHEGQLVVWNPSTGFQRIKRLTFWNKGLCSFIDSKVGCYSQRQSIFVTCDGGESWRLGQDAFMGVGDIVSLAWVTKDSLMVADRDGAIALCQVDEKGHLNNKWTVANVNAPDLERVPPDFALDSAQFLWVSVNNKLQVRTVEDGKIVASAALKHDARSIFVSDGIAYISWKSGQERGIDVWHLQEDKLTQVSTRPDGAYGMSAALHGKDAFAITSALGDNRVLARLESEITKLKPIEAIEADNTIILAEEAKTHVEPATNDELNAMRDLAKQLSTDEANSVLKPIIARNDLTPHQKAQLAIAELKKFLASKNSASRPNDVLPPSNRLLIDSSDSLIIDDAKLINSMTASPELLKTIADGLPLDAKPILYELAAQGKVPEDLINKYRAAADEAVAATKRYDKVPAPGITAVVRKNTKFILLIFEYPPVDLSPTEKQASLRLVFWVCPNCITALAVAWERNPVHLDPSGRVTTRPAATRDSTTHPLATYGERQWECGPSFASETGSYPIDSDAVSAMRRDMLRDNIIVEINTFTQNETKDKKWVTRGFSATDESAAKIIFQHLDECFKAESLKDAASTRNAK